MTLLTFSVDIWQLQQEARVVKQLVSKTVSAIGIALVGALLFTVSDTPEANAHGGGLNASGLPQRPQARGISLSPRATRSSAGPCGQRARQSSQSYANCTAAYAAGAAPLRRGDTGYGAHLDRDGDGLACENPPSGGSGYAVTNANKTCSGGRPALAGRSPASCLL